MALAKQIIVKETEQELKQLMRRQPVHLKNRVQNVIGSEKKRCFFK